MADHQGGRDSRAGDDASLLDADRVLALTRRLRDVHARLDDVRLSRDAKGRWQRRLIAISQSAQDDLADAEQQLERLVAELDRRDVRTRRR
ncbi:MAG: hypothetical protein M3N57_07550 [Actinomycetota bacterium]|nr:hypothetical protein [Actinomycetota bacterium]